MIRGIGQKAFDAAYARGRAIARDEGLNRPGLSSRIQVTRWISGTSEPQLAAADERT